MSKHTPGPWEVESDGSILCQDKYEDPMGQMRRKHVARAYIRKSDALLIAAAPDLYYALTVLLQAIRDELAGEAMSKRIVTLDEAIELSESAIAKAEGDD